MRYRIAAVVPEEERWPLPSYEQRRFFRYLRPKTLERLRRWEIIDYSHRVFQQAMRSAIAAKLMKYA